MNKVTDLISIYFDEEIIEKYNNLLVVIESEVRLLSIIKVYGDNNERTFRFLFKT